MTYTDQTDCLYLDYSYERYMNLAKKYNIKVGAFARVDELLSDQIHKTLNDYNNGALWIDEYSYCSSLAKKIVNDSLISEQEFESAYYNELLPPFYEKIGHKPICLSYSYGNDSFKDYVIPKYLAARNSEPSGNTRKNIFPTDYGEGCGKPYYLSYSAERYKSKASSMRWYDAAIEQDSNFVEQLAIVADKIDETIHNGGWLNNFTHWHNYFEDGNETWAEQYLSMLADKNCNDEICFAGYGEAVSYLVFRSMLNNLTYYMPNDNTVVIKLNYNTKDQKIDDDLLVVPISIKFSVKGTVFEGHNIKCDYNLLTCPDGNYVVEVPWGTSQVLLMFNSVNK